MAVRNRRPVQRKSKMFRGGVTELLRLEINEVLRERRIVEKALDEEGEKGPFAALLETIQEAVVIVDENKKIAMANQAFRRMFPVKWDIVGERVGLILRSEIFAELLEETRDGNIAGKKEIEFPAGEQTVWVEVSGNRMPHDGGRGTSCLFVLHDITRLKRLESVRKEFVANVSHELRTPISMIKGYAETLADPEHEISTEDRQRFLAIIEKHANRLHLLLEDLLVLSRLEGRAPQLQFELVSIEDLIREVAGTFQEALKRRGQSLRLAFEPEPFDIPLDVSKMSQVLANLLDNAVKYSPEGADIEIGTRKDGEMLEVWIKDNGAGISATDLPHIFERFYRVDKGRSRETGGTGLGLSIVKHIVQLHGGRVWAESKIGKGTRIAISLPKASPDSVGDLGKG